MNVSPEAAAAIHTLLSDRPGGLRIFVGAAEDDHSGLEMRLALTTDPDPGDEVLVTDQGSPVFVEQRLSPVLADKTLDVGKPPGDDSIGFRLVSGADG